MALTWTLLFFRMDCSSCFDVLEGVELLFLDSCWKAEEGVEEGCGAFTAAEEMDIDIDMDPAAVTVERLALPELGRTSIARVLCIVPGLFPRGGRPVTAEP